MSSIIFISLDVIIDFNSFADEMSSVEEEAYNNMIQYGLEEEVIHCMEMGCSFLEACQEWDLI